MTERDAGFVPVPATAGTRLARWRGFLAADAARRLFATLRRELPWSQHRLRLFGRECAAPRLSAWIGDPGSAYRYSGVRFEPLPWTPALVALRAELEAACACRFNSVLANLYRDGRDGMGWHADDEAELGRAPLIASLSLGATRRFLLRPRAGGERIALDLADGDLLLMGGRCQDDYRHALPKTARTVGERLNLTFRWIHPPAVPAGSPAATR